MGNLCECLEQQPPPEERKKKDHKTRLSAQQLLQSTENPAGAAGGAKKNSSKTEEDGEEEPAAEAVQGERTGGDGETGKTEAGTQEEEPAKVEEAQVETHGDPAVAETKPDGDDGEEKETPAPAETGNDDQQPLLAAEETAEPPERRQSSSSSSSSSSSDKEEKDNTDGVEEVPTLPASLAGEADQSGLETELQPPQPTEPSPPPAQPEVVIVVQQTEPDPPVDPQPEPSQQPDAGTEKQSGEAAVQQEEEVDGDEEEEEEEEEGDVDSSGDEEEDTVLVAGGSRLMRAFVDGCQINLTSLSSSQTLRIIDDGSVNAMGGFGKKATFTVHVKGVRKVALQNVRDPEKWLQVKDDELSGNGTGDEHCHFNLSEHRGYVVFEPVLAQGTHIGVRENGDVKKPSHTGTRKHARFTPTMKIKGLTGDSPLLAPFTNGRIVCLTSRASGKSLRIVEKQVNGLGGKGKKASFFVHVRRSDVIALQNVKDPQAWLRIRDSRLEGNVSSSLPLT
jgi:hypothetical protein